MIFNILKRLKLFVFLAYLLNVIFFNTLQAQQFKAFKNKPVITEEYLDTSLKEARNEYAIALKKNDSSVVIESLLSLCYLERINLNYSDAFMYGGDALFRAEELKDTLLMARANEEIGYLNYLFKQDDLAGINFKKAYTYFKISFDKKKIPAKDMYSANYNLALYYQRTSNTVMLKKYIANCAAIAKREKMDPIYKAYLDEKRASILEKSSNLNEASKLLTSSIKAINKKSSLIHNSFLIVLYSRLGGIYRKQKKTELAKQNYEKALTVKDVEGELTFYRSYVYSRYADVLYKLKDYKSSYQNLRIANEINDTYLNPRNDSNQGFLTIHSHYSEQLNAKNELLNNQKLELASQTQEILRFRILFFVIVFLLIIAALIIRSRLRFLKHQKKQQDSNEQIAIKNSELMINTLQLIEREKVIKELSNYIEKENASNKTPAILKLIRKRSVTLWEAFNNRFLALNEGFYERLKQKVPDLSSADLKVCALIKLNFSGKEMAYLLGISLGSVHVARHRLRKKMKIDRDVNLVNYINSI